MLQSIEHVAALRSQLWDCGFRPVPVLNADKVPIGRDWGNCARKDPPDGVRFIPVAHALNTGVLCDGLRAIDLDIDDPTIARQCRAIAVDMFGETPIRIRSNSPRCLLLYRAAENNPGKISITGPLGKIEVLGRGQQFVAFGTHPSGADLEWFPDAPGQERLESIHAVSEPDILAYLRAVAPLIGAEPPAAPNGHDHVTGEPQADPLRIAAALAAIPNHGLADWEWWNRVGMAVWRATGGSPAGWEAWNAWSARNPSYAPSAARARWDHYSTSPPTEIGAGTIFHMAREARRDNPEPDPEPETPTDNDRSPIFQVEFFHDIKVVLDARDFVEGVLMTGAMSVIYGESTSGKTFYATDLGLHIACGWEWNGRAIDQGGVIYLAFEGAFGIRNRVVAFREEHGIASYDIPFAIIPVTMDLLDPAADTSKLIRTIKHVAAGLTVPVRWVVGDTLSRAMAGGNENAPDDMGALVTNGTRIQQETGAAMAWVHHSGKDQARGARGHSLLRAATDTEIEVVVEEDGQRTARVTKQRDMECTGEWAFRLKPVELGKNARGKPVTSCIVDYGGKPAARRGRAAGGPGGHPQRALEILIDLCAGSGKSGYQGMPDGILSVPGDWWRERFYDRAMPGDKQDTKKHAFDRASTALINRHLVGMAGERVWVVQPPPERSS